MSLSQVKSPSSAPKAKAAAGLSVSAENQLAEFIRSALIGLIQNFKMKEPPYPGEEELYAEVAAGFGLAAFQEWQRIIETENWEFNPYQPEGAEEEKAEEVRPKVSRKDRRAIERMEREVARDET
jgi:hypothetical protein